MFSLEPETTELQVSAKEVDNRSKDELLHTISHLEGQLQEEVSSVRNFSIIGIGVFAAGLIGLLVFDASSIPLKHHVLPGLDIAENAEFEFDKKDRADKRNLDKTVKILKDDTLGSGRSILAETNFGAIYGPDAENSGAVHIAAVVDGSSAAKAKIAVGQVITSVDGKKLRNSRDYRNALQKLVNQQKVSVGIGDKTLEIVYEAKISFPDFKHGFDHFSHTVEEKVEHFWGEQKLILLKYQADRFKLKAAVKLAESYVVKEGAENERLKTAEVALENLEKEHKKRLEVREKGLVEALKLSAGHFAEICEKEEGLKDLIFGTDGFLDRYSKTLNSYWGTRVEQEVKIESGKAFAYAKDQIDADEAYKIYISWMEPKLIEYFGTPTEPRLKDYNSNALLKENDIKRPDEPASIALLKQGQSFYFRHCQHCHGVSGYGDGPTAPFLNPRPRDYTYGTFKLRSNTSSQPSIEDLERTIRYGMPGSMMPPFELYRSSDIKAVAHYVRYLSIRGQVEKMVYDSNIKSKTLQAELNAEVDPDEEPEDPMDAVKESFTDAYETVRINWQSTVQNTVKVIGEPVAPYLKVPATLGADALGALYAAKLESLQNLDADKSTDDWKRQLTRLESTLTTVKATNEATLAPLNKSVEAWAAGAEGSAADVAKLSTQANQDANKADLVLHGKDGLTLSGPQDLATLQSKLKDWTDGLAMVERVLGEWVQRTAWKASLAEGNLLFQKNCAVCHNFDGRGGLIGVQITDWGYDVLPRNLTRNVYRGGDRPIDFYWRISTGIKGSGMQAFSLEPEQKWAIVNHVRHLATTEGRK